MHAPSTLYWTALKRVNSNILKGRLTMPYNYYANRVFIFPCILMRIRWCGARDRVFTSGYLLFLGLNPISWSSKKQSTIARSSAEEEYHAAGSALAETTWVKNLLLRLNLPITKTLTIYCDNCYHKSSLSQGLFWSWTLALPISVRIQCFTVAWSILSLIYIVCVIKFNISWCKSYTFMLLISWQIFAPKPAFTHHLFKLGLITPCPIWGRCISTWSLSCLNGCSLGDRFTWWPF